MEAMRKMKSFDGRGGAQLNVPRGRWVTDSFNLTSNFTLFLEEGAVIIGSERNMSGSVSKVAILSIVGLISQPLARVDHIGQMDIHAEQPLIAIRDELFETFRKRHKGVMELEEVQ